MGHLKKYTDVLVAGAGIAGCAAAQKLQSCSIDYLLLEKHIEPGGLTRSIRISDAQFDYTGHFMHLAKCRSPSDLPFANQKDEDWMLLKRKSAVLVEGKMVPSPFQYNLYYAPKQIKQRCIKAFRKRPGIEKINSFNEYLLAGFGEGICDYFLFPYNEKFLARFLWEFSLDSITRFFPKPDSEMIESGYKKEGVNLSTGYNSNFWYPKKEGIGLLSKGLAKGLEGLQSCCPIKMVDLYAKKVYTHIGEIYYNRMLTSLPLKEFCILTNNKSLKDISSLLKHTQVLCLNILIRGSAPEVFDGYHWIYVPDKGIPFYRIGIYSNISPHMNPKDTTALYIETAFLNNAKLPDMNKLIEQIILCLEFLGWTIRDKCMVLSACWIDCAYVHFDFERRNAVGKIFEVLKEHNVYPIGRYGLWDYISMEDTILSSIEMAGRMLA